MIPNTPSQPNKEPAQQHPVDLQAVYENRLSELAQEIALRRAVNLEQQAELVSLGTHYQDELTELRIRFEAEVGEQRRKFESTLADQRALFEDTLSEQRIQSEARFTEQHRQFEARLAEQRREFESRLEDQQNLFKASLEELNQQMQARLAESDTLILARNAQIAALEEAVNSLRNERDAILNSTSWRLLTRVHRLRERIIPIGSRREKMMRSLLRRPRHLGPVQPQPPAPLGPPSSPATPSTDAIDVADQPLQIVAAAEAPAEIIAYSPHTQVALVVPISVEEASSPQLPTWQATNIEIVLPVSNASTADSVRTCLAALLEHTPGTYHLTILDQGTSSETSVYLAEFMRQFETRADSQATCDLLFAVDVPLGSSEFIILLDDAARVTPSWLERMAACAQSDPRIGIVGPLTNKPGLQSITISQSDLTWAGNPLPSGVSPDLVSTELASASAQIYPRLPKLDPCCLLLRRLMIDEIGWPDLATSLADYSQRAVAAGWQLALADDAYVYAQPSIVSAESHDVLGVIPFEERRTLQGIRERAAQLLERQQLIQQGRDQYAGKRLLFILPVAAAGGGANLILHAARTLRRMNLDAHIYNLSPYRFDFENAYPNLDIPVVYGEITDLPQAATRYDAVIATSYITVYWAERLAATHPEISIAYYIQDYEPYFDPPGSEGYAKAAASYTLLPGLIRCCTTPWIQETIQQQHQVPTTVLGPSLDINLFLPRTRQWPVGEGLRVAAMIRPSTLRRNPHGTMEILRRASQEFGSALEPVIFGASLEELQQVGMPLDFPFKLAGRLNQHQVARLMNEVDIFLDYSIFQGLGLTALEAMACGAAAVVPQYGGTATFARHEENCLVVDTHDSVASYASLQRLLTDPGLRHKLGSNGISTAAQFYPELPAFRLLQAIFPV